jgi:hypothetical protein
MCVRAVVPVADYGGDNEGRKMAKGMRSNVHRNEENAIERCDYNSAKRNDCRYRTVKFIAPQGAMKIGDVLTVDGWTAVYLIDHKIAVAYGKR